MRKGLCLGGLFVFLGVFSLPSSATAAPISCPAAPNPGDNIYTVEGTGDTTAISCVFGTGKALSTPT